MEISPKKSRAGRPARKRAYDPAVVAAVAGRLREAVRTSGQSQTELSLHLGWPAAKLSRLLLGQAESIPLDILAKLARWAESRRISLRWLLLGMGDRELSARPDPRTADDAYQRMLTGAVIVRLAELAGLDVSAIRQAWQVVVPTEAGALTVSLADLDAAIAANTAAATTGQAGT